MTPSFWCGKRVLLTGHTGFKGSWLSLWLQQLGAEVTGYSLSPPSTPSLFELADVADGMTSIEADIRNLDQLEATIREQQPEVLIHMAAQSLVRYSYDNPIETIETNVMGTANLFEAVRRTDSARVVLNITSDKCYENREWCWGYRENEPMGGHDPYSSSKGCAELITSAYRNSYFSSEDSSVVLASARAGNVIGGGDWAADRLIPDIMRSFMQNESVTIRFPNAIRPWQHVLEPLSGYMALVEKLWQEGGEYTGGWNFGPRDEDARPVLWIVDQLVKQWGDSASYHLDKGMNPHEANYLKLDCSKAHQKLQWSPQLSLNTALAWVTDWYKACYQKQNMRTETEKQITAYQALMEQ
ncbi:CDP-glucose 4,6-dehydratase [hydrothermal vent metagenome]|uniref:CDP-glucose 4,6-dehydratase n=1 Tax=hydrothermal vent metagenome TaxID=652676 RepID=A0A3B0YI87_9ZZZZ